MVCIVTEPSTDVEFPTETSQITHSNTYGDTDWKR